MTNEQIKDYLFKYNISSEDELASHIEFLKHSEKNYNDIIFPLVDLLLNETAVLLSFFRENKKRKDWNQFSFMWKNPEKFVLLNLYERPIDMHWNTYRKEMYEQLREKVETPLKFNMLDNQDKNIQEQKIFDQWNENSTHPTTLIHLSEQKRQKPDWNWIGKKETEGKLNYELDWEFIQQMAERMSTNKGKYSPYNWKKPMDVEKLKQSLLRHVIEIVKGNDSDDGRAFGHYESAALNAMMIVFQLRDKNNQK